MKNYFCAKPLKKTSIQIINKRACRYFIVSRIRNIMSPNNNLDHRRRFRSQTYIGLWFQSMGGGIFTKLHFHRNFWRSVAWKYALRPKQSTKIRECSIWASIHLSNFSPLYITKFFSLFIHQRGRSKNYFLPFQNNTSFYPHLTMVHY